MKTSTLSICEKNFILQAASESKRLDGRKLDESRDLNVYFGTDWGLCYVSLGETRVLTQVSCEVQQPKTTRPNEGLLFINVELSSMAAPHIEPGRGSDLSNHLNRLLEKCIKDSKAVDLESLCLVAEEKVWALRVDVNILNHDGNLIKCASVSALAALAHFKRPDVTSDGQTVFIHNMTDKDPIPIALHHYPVSITFALLNNGENVITDPTYLEERVSDATIVVGVNAYREICGLDLGGNALVQPHLILTCCRQAAIKAKEITVVIKEALRKDIEARQSKESHGLVECIHWNKIKSISEGRLKIQLTKFGHKRTNNTKDGSSQGVKQNDYEIVDLGHNCAELIPGQQKNTVNYVISSEENHEEMRTVSSVEVIKKTKVDIVQSIDEDLSNAGNYGEGGPSKWEIDEQTKTIAAEDSDLSKSGEDASVLSLDLKEIENIELSGDSEEDVLVLQSHDIDNPMSIPKSAKSKSKLSPLQGNKASKINESKTGEKKNKKKGQKMSKRN